MKRPPQPAGIHTDRQRDRETDTHTNTHTHPIHSYMHAYTYTYTCTHTCTCTYIKVHGAELYQLPHHPDAHESAQALPPPNAAWEAKMEA